MSEIGDMLENLKHCTCMNSLVNDLAVTCYETEDILESEIITPSKEIKSIEILLLFY